MYIPFCLSSKPFDKFIPKVSLSVDHSLCIYPISKPKSVDVANYQLKYGGAHGICCQKISEAEVFAKAGIKDILITNQICDPIKIERLIKQIGR